MRHKSQDLLDAEDAAVADALRVVELKPGDAASFGGWPQHSSDTLIEVIWAAINSMAEHCMDLKETIANLSQQHDKKY